MPLSRLNAQVQMTLYTQNIIQKISFDASLIESGVVSEKLKNELHSLVEINGELYLNLLGKKNADFSKMALTNEGILITSSVADVVNMKVPLSVVYKLRGIKGLSYLEIPVQIYPEIDGLIGDVRADSVHQGIGLDLPFSGKDVIVGVIDWGFDFTHPMFYDTSLNKNRIIACWDHWKKSGPGPEKYGYGTVYYGTDELMQAQSDTANNRGFDTHGSHVAGIAGGGGAGVGLKGVAYDCEFLFIQVDWQAGTFMDGVDWMKSIADDLGKRLVINMSFGSYHRATLDTVSFFHTVIKEYSKMGVVMVTSAGNNGNNKMHISKAFNKDTIRSQISMLPNNTSFPRYNGHAVIMWGEKEQSFKAGFDIYNASNNLIHAGELFNTKEWNRNLDSFISIDEDTLFYEVEVESLHPLNQKPNMVFKLSKTQNNWKIALRSTAEKGVVHYWNLIRTTTGISNTGQPFISTHSGWFAGNDSFTVSDPGVVPDVITVAAHNTQITAPNGMVFPGAIANFSSKGPTLDGLIKPDVSAPGVQILSSVSSFTSESYTTDMSVEFNEKKYDFSRFSGTSMSGPAVAGVAALLLEANPYLSPAQVKEILRKTARKDIRTGDLPEGSDNTWGTGKVDAYAAIKLALDTEGEMKPVEVVLKKGVIYPNPSPGKVFYNSPSGLEINKIKVFDMNGKQVLESTIGTASPLDLSYLRAGMYVVKIMEEKPEFHKLILFHF